MSDMIVCEQLAIHRRGHGAKVQGPRLQVRGVGYGLNRRHGLRWKLDRKNLVHWGANRLHDIWGHALKTDHDMAARRGDQ
jgi:hypothetical protein